MHKKPKNFSFIITLAFIVGVGSAIYVTSIANKSVSAASTSLFGASIAAKCASNASDVGGICVPNSTGLSGAPIYLIISNIFSWLMALFTFFSIGAFVVSGIQYLMAAGDESLAESAKKNATYAILGIIVGLSGFIVVRAVNTALNGGGYIF